MIAVLVKYPICVNCSVAVNITFLCKVHLILDDLEQMLQGINIAH